jgi:hypothetical protein
MLHKTRLVIVLIAIIAVIVGASDYCQAQPNPSNIRGTLNPIRSYGPCKWSGSIATDNTPTKVMGLWFLKDHKDTSVSSRGIELRGSPDFTVNMPNTFYSRWYLIPNTLYQYGSAYKFSNWNRKNKTVSMLKEAWVYQGWGSSTTITCYGSWAGTVSYK